MASFMIYALASGYTMPLEKGGYRIAVEEVALVAYNRFNFEGEQDYGYWSCEERNFTAFEAVDYTNLTNNEFNSFRNAFHKGDDFIVIAPPKDIAFGAPYVYTYNP